MRLEYLRGAASFYILLHHFVRINLPEYENILPRFFVFGQLAVLLFFLLSGFVVHYATLGQDPNMTFQSYFVRRFRRIFPVFIIALGIAYASASIIAGHLVDPEPRNLVLNLLQFQDRDRPGNWTEPYWHNAPLWSLSYEWWFYMWYFALHVIFLGRAAPQRYAVLGIAIAGFLTDVLWPNPVSHVASYLVIWWLGVELAREYLRHGIVTLKNQWLSLLSVMVLTALWFVPVVIEWVQTHQVAWYDHPALTFRHFLTVLAVVAGGWIWYKPLGLRGFDRMFRVFGWLAPVSYCLYVIHFPLLRLFAQFGHVGFLAFFYITPTILLLSWVIEQPLQKRINRLLQAPLPRPGTELPGRVEVGGSL
jgi:peptidoglycan/LPS O-acetylase OafA/YrhL